MPSVSNRDIEQYYFEMFRKNYPLTLKDLSSAHRAIEEVTGRVPRLFRPPYSHVNGHTLLACTALGYDLVMWNRYIGDRAFQDNEPGLVDEVVNAAAPGAIFLGHDAGKLRLIAIRNLAKIIQELKRLKYEFVTISQLREISRSNGGTTRSE